MRPILDAEMPEQGIWPVQADRGGLAWTLGILLSPTIRQQSADHQQHVKDRRGEG